LCTDGVIIREGEHEDLDAVAALWDELTGLHHALDNRFWIRAEDGREKYGDWVAEGLDEDDRMLVVAETRGRVVGFIHGMLKDAPAPLAPKLIGHVTDLVVAEGHRRRGVGTRLVEAASRWFREKDAQELTLNAAVCNRRAREFWEAMGFEPWTQTLWKPLA
jgi:ribosomal protein S18 acetylase RimI-like enzyme